MAKRKIIKIDADKCTGCGLCIPNCPEGALQMIDEKARVISDLFCDGLGACIGHCPEGAISIEEREAEAYDEKKTMANIVKHGENTIKAHLVHLKEHGEKKLLKQAMEYLNEERIAIPQLGCHGDGGGHACPGSKMMEMKRPAASSKKREGGPPVSQLAQWPVQLALVPPLAPYLNNADILVAADCVPFAYADFHEDLLKGKVLLVGCPKLDDVGFYKEKITNILKANDVKSITYAHMEVPCCSGLIGAIEKAIEASGKKVPFKDVTISASGERME